jgi:hypothetical protein
VQVKKGKIVDVSPYFLEKDQVIIKPSRFFRNKRFRFSAFSDPLSLGSTIGVESPVPHNIFGTARRWLLAFNWYILLNRKGNTEDDYGRSIKFSLGLSYKF